MKSWTSAVAVLHSDTFRWLFKVGCQQVWSPVAWPEKILAATFHNHVKKLPWRHTRGQLRKETHNEAELVCDAWVENSGGPSHALISCLAGEVDKERNASGEGAGAESSHEQPTSGNFQLPQSGSAAQNNGQNLGEYAWMHSALEAFAFRRQALKKGNK